MRIYMLKTKLFLATIVMIIAGTTSFGIANAAITGSVHDFSERTWNNNGNGRICVVCHTPHNSDNQLIPLWNHETTQATFTLYNSSNASTSLDATMTNPTGVSRACLSCHDGTVAVDQFGSNTNASEIMSGNTVVGINSDLSNDHPVSFVFDEALSIADGGLVNPATSSEVAALLIGDRLECSSCHDVHNGGEVSDKLLVLDNTGSALCLTCHTK